MVKPWLLIWPVACIPDKAGGGKWRLGQALPMAAYREGQKHLSDGSVASNPPSTGIQPVPGILHTLISLIIAGDHIAVLFAP